MHVGLVLLLAGAALGSHAACSPELNCCSTVGGGATCGGAGIASLGNTSATNQGAGNPIDIITGNKYQQEVDLPALPGVMGLEIVRHYNSVRSGIHSRNGILGRGWKLSYETELQLRGMALEVTQADGSVLVFERTADGALYRTANALDGYLRARSTERGVEHLWTWPNGRQLSFDAGGKLVQIAAPTGEFVSLTRDAQGWLVGVTDPQGRSLRLNYLDRRSAEHGQRFRGVQSIDSPVGRFRYEYGSDALSSAAAGPATAGSAAQPGMPMQTLANLVKVGIPTHHDAAQKVHERADRGLSSSSVSRIYHYEDARFPTLLTGISVVGSGSDGKLMSERIASYRYDATGLGVLSVKGEAAAPPDAAGNRAGESAAAAVAGGGIEQVVFDRSRRDETIVTNSLGQTTRYRHAKIGGQPRLLEVRGAGCASCGPSNVRYGYDALGRLVATTMLDRNGMPLHERRVTLDALGRPLRIERIDYHDGKALAPRWLLRYEYGGSGALDAAAASDTPRDGLSPTLVAKPSVIAGREHRLLIVYNAAGQPLQWTEEGYSPLDEQGVESPLGTPITRSVRYGYRTINGRSLPVQFEGPLPNGTRADPGDSDITRLQWDERGRFVETVTRPGGFASRTVRDSAGRTVAQHGADGTETRLSYDARSQLTRVAVFGPGSQEPQVRSFLYDALGRRVEAGQGDAGSYRAQVHHGFDAADRMTWSASATGILQRNRFDTEGKLLETRLASANYSRAQHFEYDEFNRLVGVSDEAGVSRHVVYGKDDLPSASVDSLGRETRYAYDAQRRPLALTAAANAIAVPLQDTTLRFERDATETVTTVTAANGAAVRHLRDDFGRTVATISSDSGTSTRRFDAADRLIEARDANGNRADYEYDAAGRISRQTVTPAARDAGAPPTVTTWSYEGTRLVAVEHPVRSERYRHDAQGRIASKTVMLRTGEGSVMNAVTRYRYGAQGLLEAVSLPDGSVIEHRRNGLGELVALSRRRIATPWLAWLLPDERVIDGIERILGGLARFRYGNGVEAEFGRSRSGVLAQLQHRGPRGPLLEQRYLWDTEGNLLRNRGLGRTLHYAYDAQDRLIVAAGVDTRAADAATPADDGVAIRPVSANDLAATRPPRDGGPASSTPYSREGAAATSLQYHFVDGTGNRLLSRGPASDDRHARTVRMLHGPGDNRWRGNDDLTVQHDRNGQPIRVGARAYEWDALGRLAAVREQGQVLARYRYSHRGERVGKTVARGAARAHGPAQFQRAGRGAVALGGRSAADAANRTTHYLHEGRRLTAELDESGKLVRQYIYLAGQAVAVIDTPAGVSLADGERPAWAQVLADLTVAVRAWLGKPDRTFYLHANHLGAPEVVTDDRAESVWRAHYDAFGKTEASVAPAIDAAGDRPFTLDLRLPGQLEDPETGLHYNDHRYYDPRLGRYLTPDPLGLPGGINGYAYAAGNPLKYIDPSGLILFAFDGTGNSADPAAGDTISNVRKFLLAYDQDVNGPAFYITGIGTVDENMPYRGNILTGAGFDERVQLGFTFLERFIDDNNGSSLLQIDAVGFSRGAAEARVWINLLVAAMNRGAYKTAAGNSRCLNLRFEGLWDTVPHLMFGEGRYDFSIPTAMGFAAHAVALNEHRGGIAHFNVRSILDAPATTSGGNRNEMGFIGSHADIGGSYGTGDLSNVALMWMIEQAKLQGIKFRPDRIADEAWDVVSNPLVHDKSLNKIDPQSQPTYEDRDVVYGGGMTSTQRAATIGGNDTAWARSLVSYYGGWRGLSTAPEVGVVDMANYVAWLRGQGVNIAYAPTVPARP